MTVQTHTAWQYRNPADLIGRRCIALTGMDVTLDGPLDLIRLSPIHAVLKYRGIGLHVIDCDLPADCTLEIRETPKFLEIAHRVREGLRAGHSYDD